MLPLWPLVATYVSITMLLYNKPLYYTELQPSPNGKDWVLMDVANSTQLGTAERLKAKGMKIQATHTMTKGGESDMQVKEDKTIMSDVANSPKKNIGDKEESEAFIQHVQDAVAKDAER